jgi:hypothetical protein
LINSVQQFTTNVDLDAYMREEEDKCGSDVHCHWTSIVNKVIGTITKITVENLSLKNDNHDFNQV